MTDTAIKAIELAEKLIEQNQKLVDENYRLRAIAYAQKNTSLELILMLYQTCPSHHQDLKRIKNSIENIVI
jgi:hypothetical protein